MFVTSLISLYDIYFLSIAAGRGQYCDDNADENMLSLSLSSSLSHTNRKWDFELNFSFVGITFSKQLKSINENIPFQGISTKNGIIAFSQHFYVEFFAHFGYTTKTFIKNVMLFYLFLVGPLVKIDP